MGGRIHPGQNVRAEEAKAIERHEKIGGPRQGNLTLILKKKTLLLRRKMMRWQGNENGTVRWGRGRLAESESREAKDKQ